MAVSLPVELRRLADGPADHLEVLNRVAWASVDPVELELCRLHAAAALGDHLALNYRTPEAVAAGLDEARVAALSSWWGSPAFSRRERAALAFTEQFLFAVSGICDNDIDALLVDRSPAEVYALVSAVYVVEMTIRVNLAARLALPEVTATA
jgi:alkylhydroperoxidase family enzyme